MKLRTILKLLLPLLLYTSMLAQNLSFDHITMADGLSYDVITGIVQDEQGFMWISTIDGLNKFDGYDVTKYYHQPDDINSISGDFIQSLYLDRSGNIWVCGVGLSMFDPESERFTVYLNDPDNPESLSNNNVTSIIEDRNGNFWIGTAGGGLNKLDRSERKFQVFKNDPGNPGSISDNNINIIYEDHAGAIWIGTFLGLNKLIPGDTVGSQPSFNRIIFNPRDPDYLSLNDIRSIYEDGSGNLWIGTFGGGLMRLDRESGNSKVYTHHPQHPNSLSNNIVHTIFEDQSGTLWIGTNLGLNRFNRESGDFTVTKYHPLDQDGLTDNRISIICEDHSGILWIGTGNGINLLDTKRKKFTTIKMDQIDPGSTMISDIYSIYQDHYGLVWIGTGMGRLIRIEPETGSATFYGYDPSRQNNLIRTPIRVIHEDGPDNMWIGTFGNGLLKFNRKTGNLRPYLPNPGEGENLSDKAITTMYEDQSGIFWFGTFTNGLIRFDPTTYQAKSYKTDPQDSTTLANNWVISILEDRSGMIWVGTVGGGLCKFNPVNEEFITYRHDPQDPSSISHYAIMSLLEDQSGNIWAGTWGGGLNKFVPGKNSGPDRFIRYNMKDGLSNNSIVGLLEDEFGHIWISTNNGLSMLNPDSEEFRNYSVLDGLQDYAFNPGACYKGMSGQLLFGGDKGINAFYPDSIRDNPVIPPVAITSLKLFNEPVYPGIHASLNKSISYTRKIELSYKENFISFEFVALNYTNPEKNKYKYRMVGIDRDTVYAGTKRYAEYSDIKPGRYTFWVTGSNNDEIWNPAGTSIDLIIHPPWYRTILAYIVYFIMMLMSIYGYMRYHTWRLRKDKVVLEKQVKERTKVIAEQNDEIRIANSELEKQKNELMHQKDELKVALFQLKQTQTQLIQSEKLAALGGLVAGIAHEINTPVGICVTAASSLIEETDRVAKHYQEDKISRAEFKEYLNDANQSAKLILSNMERTAAMVQSFKQLSADQSSEQMRFFKLRAYTEDIVRSLYPKLRNRKVSIDIDIDEKLEMHSYPGALSQIITNLIINSLEHAYDMEDKGRILIKAIKSKEEIRLEYSDNGKGIPEDVLSKIYEPFFTTNKILGTGLGMHIVYNLVTQKLNGSIECTSELKKGARFVIIIPVGE